MDTERTEARAGPIPGKPRRALCSLIGLLALAVVGLSCSRTPGISGPPSPPTHTKAPRIGSGWLHTKGTKIVDDDGKEVRFTGVGVQSLQGTTSNKQPFEVLGQEHFDNMAEFGFNQVRLPIRWLFLEPTAPTRNSDGTLTHHWDKDYVDAMDSNIRELGKRGIKVIISMNGIPSRATIVEMRGVASTFGMPQWLYPNPPARSGEARCDFFANSTQSGVPVPSVQDGLADAWRFVAGRYADDPTVVGADIINEPYLPENIPACGNTAENLRNTLTNIGSAIHEANPKLLLVFEDGSQTKTFLSSPPQLPNLVYSFHVYQLDLAGGMETYEQYRDRARGWNVPLYMGEFNAFGGATRGGGPNWQADTEKFLATMKMDRVSWTFWAYCCGGNSLFIQHTFDLKPELLPILQSGFDSPEQK